MDENRESFEPLPPSPLAGGVGDNRAPGSDAASSSSSPKATSGETDPFVDAGSQIVELIRRFIEDVGRLKREARLETESARAAHADAERTRQEAIRLRADAQAEAARIVDAAREEANRIREAERTRAADAKRLVRDVADDLERAQGNLAEAIARLGAEIGEPASHDIAVIPDASDETSVA